MAVQAEPGTKTVWRIDPAHSLVEFSVKHMMVTNVKGRFGSVGGTIETVDENIADAYVDVEIEERCHKHSTHEPSSGMLI